MRILVVTPYLACPGTDGGGTVMFNFIKNLSARHEVACLTFARQQDLPHLTHLEPYCIDITTVLLPGGAGLSPLAKLFNLGCRVLHNILSIATFTPVVVRKCMSRAMEQELRRAIERHKPDIVHLCFPQMAHYVEVCAGVPAVMDTLDVALLGVYRRAMSARQVWGKAYYLMQWRFWVRYESRWFPRFGKVLTVTRQDAAALNKILPNLDVYADAIAVEIEPHPEPVQRPTRRIGFLASFGHQPNVDAALYFADEIFPLVRERLADAEFVVAGKNPPAALCDRAPEGISCVGFVDEVATFYGGVDVVVAPIRYGGGIKIKVLEAMACGKAVVTTSVGAEGIAESDDGLLMVADNPEAFAVAVLELLTDEALRKALGDRARQLMDQRFSWQRVIDDLEGIYTRLKN